MQHIQLNDQPSISSMDQFTTQSRVAGTQQDCNACPLSGQSTFPAPFPGRASLGNQHVTNSQMNAVIDSLGSLSTDQSATYDNILTDAMNGLNPNSSADQRSCVQSRYHFGCGCRYDSPPCQCCRAPSPLALPSTPGVVQVEHTHFSVYCADCTIMTVDFQLEFAKQDAEEDIGLFYENCEDAWATDPEFMKQSGRYQALVQRVKNERPVVDGWTKTEHASR